MTISNHILQQIKSVLHSISSGAKVILYGSQARGDAREDSDIDLLILLPDEYEAEEFVRKKFEISDALYDLSLSLGVDISPFVTGYSSFYSRKTLFTLNIERDGIEL